MHSIRSDSTKNEKQDVPGPNRYDSSALSGVYSELIRRVLYPRLLKRWRPSAQFYLHELQKLEFASFEVVEAIQLAKLLKIVRHAGQHVPYYRSLFREQGLRPEDIRTRGDVARIPILTKSVLKEKLNELCAENRDKACGQPNASGGSTGKPVQFFQDADYWDHACASQWFVESWWGIRPGDRTASVWGADRDICHQSWKERFFSAIEQVRVCNAFSLGTSEMTRFAKMLAVWNPHHVVGYASALELFAKFLLERQEVRIRPTAMKATAEVLGEKRRQIIESAFGCRVYNFYGSREVNNLAVECPSYEGLHANALLRYIEIVDDKGNAVSAGVPGRILITDLTNYFMPFLRYEIEDIGSWSGTQCRCGRPFPLLAKIWGRSSDFIVTPAGKWIHGEFFTHLFYDLPEIASFQVEQSNLHEIRVDLVLRPGTREYRAPSILERFRRAVGPDVTVQLQVVPKIDRPHSGKHRFAVSSVPVRWEARKQSLGHPQ
jgi:phenylacetate-CoA ligase